MTNFSCRGATCRENVVKHYKLTPVAYVKLLNGQSKISCTGALLTDAYYLFEYQHKTQPNDTGSFYCGSSAAQHFLKLIRCKPLTVFDPFVAPPKSIGSSEKGVWNEAALQLYVAIHLIIICWNKPIYGKLVRIKQKLEKKPFLPPFYDDVLFVNNIIAKDAKKRTLDQILEELKTDNPKLYNYTFYELTKLLNHHKVMSKFEF